MKYKNIKNFFNKSVDILRYVVAPDTCLHCKIDLGHSLEKPLCPKCESALEIIPKLYCRRCGVVLMSGGAHCYRCRGYKASSYKCLAIRSALVFNSQIRSVIHHFKYRQKTKLVDYLGNFLLDAFKRYSELTDCNLIIPVAISAKRTKTRGFNQSQLLGEYLSKHTGIEFSSNILIKTKNTTAQVELTRAQRTESVKDAFAVKKPLEVGRKNILLIDDVATTGSTLEACAIALKKAKARKVKALTIARE